MGQFEISGVQRLRQERYTGRPKGEGCARHAGEIFSAACRSHDLPLDLEPDFQPDLELLDFAVLNPAALLRDLKPIYMADCLRYFCDSGLRRFSKAYGRCSYQLGDFVCSGHVSDSPRIRDSQKYGGSLRLTGSKAYRELDDARAFFPKILSDVSENRGGAGRMLDSTVDCALK
jgi:hypothetical protein